MDADIIKSEEQVASYEGVVVRRSLSAREGGIVGTVRIEADRQRPVEVHVVDDFPAQLPVASAGFKPGSQPDSGNVTSERAEIIQQLGDDPAEIQYGLKLSEAVGEVQFDSPTIRDVRIPEESAVPQTDGGEPSSGNGEESSRSFSSMIPTFGGDKSDAQESSPGQRPTEVSTKPAATDQTAATDEVSQNASGENDHETDGGNATEPATSGTGKSHAPEAGRDGSAAAMDPGDSAGIPRAVELRLDRLSARVEKFAAYANTLQPLIEEHGTASEFLTEINDEFAALDNELLAVREEMASLQTQHNEAIESLQAEADAISDRLDDAEHTFDAELEAVRDHVDDEVGEVRSHVDAELEAVRDHVDDEVGEVRSHVDAELEDVRSHVDTEFEQFEETMSQQRLDIEELGERVSTVEDDVQNLRGDIHAVETEVATVSEDLQDVLDELEALRTEVEELDELRESLANVFGSPLDAERPMDE